MELSYKIYKSLGHSHTRARQNRKAMNPETVLTFFPAAMPMAAFGFTLTVTSLTRRSGVYYFNIVNG
jgi:hypothetical protein